VVAARRAQDKGEPGMKPKVAVEDRVDIEELMAR
jgi:hypothetical protein